MRNVFVVPKIWIASSLSLVFVGALFFKNAGACEMQHKSEPFNYVTEQFADLRILRYQIPGFENLSLKQKELLYYLSQAASSGRDIAWDQNYKHNLEIRKTLEAIVRNFKGDKTTEDFKNFMIYVKRVWFSKGIHHHYSNDKIMPNFTKEYLSFLNERAGSSPVSDTLMLTIFDPEIAKKKVNLDPNSDMALTSAVNFYEGVNQAEVQAYYRSLIKPNNDEQISYGLNSKLVKVNGLITERVYKAGGMYSRAIEKIVYWLKKAVNVAESDLQKNVFLKLIEFYQTGDLKRFDEYNILWVQDTESVVDAVNGFIETYDDPFGYKGTWESVVSIKDQDATQKFGVLSREAGWFEKNSPIMEAHKRESVTGVSYKIINVVNEAGGSSPATPIGINLPNADWIRAKHGSKSVSLGNIESAYNEASKSSGALAAFYLLQEQAWIKENGEISDKLHTGLHEVVGHASGKIMPGVGPTSETLKNYAGALEEGRADLVGLYYIGDQHLVDIGVSPTVEIMKAQYSKYITNGLLTQLARIELGKDVEEAHMRNRQMISKWVFEQGKAENVIERKDVDTGDGVSTYFVINDFAKLRVLFGKLLREVQRIKSEGDYEAGKNLIENYGVKIDHDLHVQVKRRWDKLHLAPYAGFINPLLKASTDRHGNVTDVLVTYPDDFTKQQLDYSERFSFLPIHN